MQSCLFLSLFITQPLRVCIRVFISRYIRWQQEGVMHLNFMMLHLQLVEACSDALRKLAVTRAKTWKLWTPNVPFPMRFYTIACGKMQPSAVKHSTIENYVTLFQCTFRNNDVWHTQYRGYNRLRYWGRKLSNLQDELAKSINLLSNIVR